MNVKNINAKRENQSQAGAAFDVGFRSALACAEINKFRIPHSALIIIAAFALIRLCAASPLDGYYRITSLQISEDGGQTRGFNNTDLYIYADGRRVSLVGAFRGYPFRQSAFVERTVGDTLVLRDADDRASTYKFHVRNNVITGRHSMRYDDGTRKIINTRATIRQMNQGEIDRLRTVLNLSLPGL